MAERALIPRVQYEFHMRITVLEPKGKGGHRIARIQFSTLEDAPAFARGTFVLELYANTGKPKALKEIDGNCGGSNGIVRTAEERVLFSTTPGFPTAWIVNAADLARMPTEPEERKATIEQRNSIGKSSYQFVKKLRPTVTADGEHKALEVDAASIKGSPGASRRVVQTWVPGEGWWRSFTRYSHTGNPDLEATLVEHEEE